MTGARYCRCQLWVSEKPEPRRWTAIVSYTALAVSFAAFLANILGYITLANWLGNGLLQSSYLALVLYALVVVLSELGQMALEARPLAASASCARVAAPVIGWRSVAGVSVLRTTILFARGL